MAKIKPFNFLKLKKQAFNKTSNNKYGIYDRYNMFFVYHLNYLYKSLMKFAFLASNMEVKIAESSEEVR